MSETTPDRNAPSPKGAHARLVTSARSLDELVGAHPDALLAIYGTGSAADPEDLGFVQAPARGRFLCFVQTSGLHLAARPFVKALATDRLPWRGKIFEPGGGANLLFGRPSYRFATEVGPSQIDGLPTLILRYDAHGHGWPVRLIRDELRTIGPGLAIGPAFLSDKVVLWFGLERAVA